MSSTLTTFLNLWKPTPGTKEPYNQVNENANLDAIDKAIGPKFTNTANGNFNNTTAENQVYGATILSPASQQTVWRIVVWGVFGTTATPTVTFRAKLGGVQFGGVVATTAVAGASKLFRCEAEVVCMTTGVSGTWSGILIGQYNDGSAMKSFVDGAQPTFTRDTTASNTLEVTAQFSAASASNSLTVGGGYVHRVTNA